MSKTSCVACRRTIDAAARVCPFCGASPTTGEKIDSQAMLQEVFKPKHLSTSETVLEYARQRQGIVVALAVTAGFLVLAALHQFVTRRNATAVTSEPAMPLTEIADLNRPPEESPPLPMPKLDFQYVGQAQRLRTYIVEPGAIPPTERSNPRTGKPSRASSTGKRR